MMSSVTVDQYDVVIVGGGIVGLTMALALAQQTTLSIALVDQKKLLVDWKNKNAMTRVSAVSLASERIFRRLNCWAAIQEKRVSPYTKMQVWEAEGGGEIHFDADSLQVQALGYIIEDNVIRQSLLEKLEAYDQVKLFSPLKLISLKEQANAVVLQAENDFSLKAKLVIASDGGDSWVRDQAEIPLKTRDYDHDALVATVRTEFAHESTARQRFLPTGPLAFLPLTEAHECSIVWSAPPEQISLLLSQADEVFKKTLAQAFGRALGEVTVCSQRMSFPLKMRHAKHYVHPRLALIGDAAHTIHPLAGQGLNLGLLDAACLLEVIVDAMAKNRDFAAWSTLRRYERWRKGDNVMMLAAVEGLKRLFMSESKPMKHWRNRGLNLADQLSFVKNALASYAMGNRDDMPKLACS